MLGRGCISFSRVLVELLLCVGHRLFQRYKTDKITILLTNIFQISNLILQILCEMPQDYVAMHISLTYSILPCMDVRVGL